MDKRSNDRITRTSGVNTWRAGCGESRTSGSEGGPGKPTSRKADRAPWPDPYTYVATWSGTVYVAFVIDVFSRRIVGWRASTSMSTELVLDCLEHAVWARTQDGVSDLAGLVHHTDAGSQYTSFAFTSRLIEAGVDPSVGSVGDAYDNALAESQIGAYKTELIRPEGPWRDVEHVELETLRWVHWFNYQRPHESVDDLTPIEVETTHYAARNRLRPAGPVDPGLVCDSAFLTVA